METQATVVATSGRLRILAARDAGAAFALPFLLARIVVLGAFGLAAFLHSRLDGSGAKRYESLLGWDADWYRRIASYGYQHLPVEALRFFPLLPLVARSLAPVVGGAGMALLVVGNTAALLYSYLLHRLAVREGLGEAVARRAVWVLAFTPAAFVLVMGYTEALAGCLLVGLMLAVRDRRWLLAVPIGAASGGLRPTGVLVTILVAGEASRGLLGCSLAELGRRALATLAPTAGALAYLGWVSWRFGDALAPFHIQTAAQLRGGVLLDPRPALRAAASSSSAVSAHPETLHLLWLLLSLALLLVSARRLPASFTAYAAAVLLLGATARAFTSFERYAGSAVPLLLAAAIVLRTRVSHTAALAVASAVLAGYALTAALHLYIP